MSQENDPYVTMYRCNLCKEQFKTRGEAYAHHYNNHKKISLK